MNKNGILLALLLVALAGAGCMQVHYERRGDDVVSFSAWSLFADEKLSKLSIDRVTKATSSGVTVGSIDSEVNAEALNGVTESIVSGVVKAIISKP